MTRWGTYTLGHLEINRETRMTTISSPPVEEFLALPDGTEITVIRVGMLGIELQAINVDMSDTLRTAIREWAQETGAERMDFAIAVVLLPDDMEMPSDLGEILDAEAMKLGIRHGTEGSPAFSEGMLKSRLGDRFTDTTHTTYVKAYKTAASRRKGH